MTNKTIISLAEAKPLILKALAVNVVPMLHGSPAIGKSSVCAEIADEYNLLLLDERLSGYDSTDMNGLVNFTEDKSRSQFIPMMNFPLDTDELPINPKTGKPYAGWLLLLDELPSAERPVLAASYKLILDRMVGQRKLHPKVWMIAAGNMDTDGAIVNDMGTALMSRMMNLYIQPKREEWLEYAESASEPLDYRISAFLGYRKDLFFSFHPDTVDDTFPAPRTWSMLSKLIRNIPVIDSSYLALITGVIGVGPGAEFYAFLQFFDRITTYSDVVSNPKTARIPSEPGMIYAMAAMLGKSSIKADIAPVLEYVKRLPIDFQMITLRGMISSKTGVETTPEFDAWLDSFNGKLYN